MMSPGVIEAFGLTFRNATVERVLDEVLDGLLTGPEFQYMVTLNAVGVAKCQKDPDFLKAVQAANYLVIDGKGLELGLKMLGNKTFGRIAGIDFAEQLCRVASLKNIPVFFLGGKPGVAQKAAEQLQRKYPGLNVCGTASGYYTREQENQVIKTVKRSGAKILLVGMGMPRQEIFFHANSGRLPGITAIGVGGSFDVFSGQVKRAPMLVQKIGMEWFFRFIQEPKRFILTKELWDFIRVTIREKSKQDRRNYGKHQ